MKPIDNAAVENMLISLPPTSKNDVLDIDTKLLSLSSHIISPSLTKLFNMSFEIGYLPTDWKTARVSPAYKGKRLHE
jgi:hypothetical protein